MSAYKFKTTNIKGKQYVDVSQRVLYFRSESKYEGWSIHNEIVAVDAETCIVKSSILDQNNRLIASAHAQEDRSSSNINRVSYIENCETSAVGRALAMLGIGIETSIASANEVSMAVAKDEVEAEAKEESLFEKSVNYIKSASNKKEAYTQVLSKYGEKFSDKQKEALQKFVK
jgi:hypothetical protein